MNRIIFAIPLLVLLMLIGLMYMKLTAEKEPYKLVSKPLPEFSIDGYDLEGLGRTMPLTQNNLKEKRVKLLNFFATWCTPCIAEHRQLVILSRDHGLDIYGIAYKDERSELDKYFRSFGNPYLKVGFDPKGNSLFYWGGSGVPESFLIDAEGNIRYHHIGPILPRDLTDRILPIIKEIGK